MNNLKNITNFLRKRFRRIVLPSEEIKIEIDKQIDFRGLDSIVDFGAGSLFWSEYFANKVKINGGGGTLLLLMIFINLTFRLRNMPILNAR